MFCKGRALKKSQKISKKSIKNPCKFWVAKKESQNGFRSGFGRVWDSIWEGFGTLWALFWALLGPFWSFFGNSKSYLCKALVQDELQEAFWMDFKSLWEALGSVLEGFGEQFGRVWGLLNRYGADFGNAWHYLALLRQSFQIGPPRWSAKRHNARGSPPSVVEQNFKWTYNGCLGGQTGQRGDRHPKWSCSFWGHVGLFFWFFRNFSHFFRIF